MRRLILGLVLLCSSAFAQRPLPGGGAFGGGAGGGSGDVLGPVSSTDNQLVVFSGTSGKIIKVVTGDGLVTATSGVFGTTAAPVGGIVGTTDTQTLSGKTLTSPVITAVGSNPTCGAGDYIIWANSGDLKLKKCQNGTISDLDAGGGGSSGFDAILTGTNTTAAMVVGSGSSLATSGTGFITANRFTGLDSVFTLQDDGDATKQTIFQLSGITTGTTRTVTIANANSVTVVSSTAGANQFATAVSAVGVISYAQPAFTDISGAATNAQLPTTISTRTLDNTNVFTIRDDRLTLQDNADTTKQLVLQLSAIGTSTTRTLNIPDADTVTVVASTAGSNQFATGISSAGAVSYAQPAFTNISGTATNGQLPATLSSKTLDNTNTITVLDANLTVQDDGDAAKQAKFQLSGITSGNTRTVTIANAASVTVISSSAGSNQFASGIDSTGTITYAQPSFANISGTATNGQLPTTLSSKVLDNSNTITALDTLFTLQDDGGTTRQARFQLSGITAGQTRIVNIVDAATSQTVISSSAPSNQFATGIGADGIVTYAQPSFANLSGTASATQGGTAQSTWTLGDLLYASASNTLSKLAGNTTTTKQFLRQTGNGSISAAPAWDTLVAGDIPDISATYQVLSAKNAASGYAGLTAGTKLTLAQGQEVWALADLTDASGTTGTGSTVVLNTAPTLNGTTVIGDGSGNDKLEFFEEATNPSCGAGVYAVWANSADTKLKKCENGSITDLAPSGGAVAYSSITSATSTNAFVMGTGGTLGFSGTGTIDSNRFKGNATIAVADGGTNKTAWTQYAIPYASTTAIISEINIGTAGQCLQVNGGATGYQWGSCGGGSPTIQNNGSAVGSQPIINFIPGTGMTYTITENVGATRIDTTQGIDTTIVPRFASAGTFTAKQSYTVTGGIAAFKITEGIAPTTTLTAGDFYVNSTSHKVFHYDGSGFVGLMNNLMTTQGDITTAGASGAEQRLALGATGTFLYSNGTDPIWRQPLASDISNAFDTNADNAIGGHFVDLTNIAPPANPAATHARLYFRTSTSKLACIDSAGADCMPAGAGGGDFSSNTSSSVDSEIVLFSGIAGKTGKRATGTGLATLTSGVLGAVTAPSGAVVGTTDTQTLSAKTLTTPILTGYTVAGLPAAGTTNRIAIITDASSPGSLTGGGTSRTFARDTGAAWEALGDGGSGGGGGADDVGANAGGASSFSLSKASATTWTIPGTVHGLGTCDILYSFYSTSGTVRSRVDPQSVTCETVAGSTQYDVTVTWASAQAGRIIMQRAMVGPDTYAVDKTSATSWTIAGTLHGMAGCNLTYAFYSTSGTVRSLIEPQAITCETAGGGTQYDITVTWASAQAGRAVFLRNSQRSYSTSKASATTWTITGDTHGQRTCDLSHMFTADSGTLRAVIQPQSVSCETAAGSSQYDLTVTWASAQAGYVNIATAGGIPLLTMGAYTVANLPAAGIANRVAIATDSLTAGNCTTGGGSARTLCRDTGSAWESLGGGGSGLADPGANGLVYRTALNTTSAVTGSTISGGIVTLNPSTTPGNALVLDIAAIGSAGTRDSQNLVFTGRSNDGTDHNVDWRLVNDVTSNAGASTLALQSRIDAGSFTSRLTITDGSVVGSTVFDAATGFRIGGAGTTDRYLKGNGTNFVISSGAASGTGTCTNQFARVLNSDAAPTCATVGAADTDETSFAAVTWLANADSTWTFDTTGATSPVLSFTGSNINVSTGGLQIGGAALGALVTAGSAGIAAFNQGTATTGSRSDHTHRTRHTLTWHFPGTPATGVAPLTLTFPEGATNLDILDMRVTVNTTSASTSSFNIQRCTASCTGTTPTFANIFSSDLSLAANTRTVAKASAPDQNVSSLVGNDQWKANIVTVGASLADVTIVMTFRQEILN